jgi:hypothetical protein
MYVRIHFGRRCMRGLLEIRRFGRIPRGVHFWHCGLSIQVQYGDTDTHEEIIG